VTPEERAVIAQIDLTPTEDENRLAEVFRLLTRGYTDALIVRIARGELGIGAIATRSLIAKVHESLKTEADARKPYARAVTIARLHDAIEKFKTPRYKTVKRRVRDPNTGTMVEKEVVEELLPPPQYVRCEELLADIEGTRAPQKVIVEHALKESLMAVLSTLTPERTQGLLERARERKRLAAASQVVEMAGE